MGWDFQTHTNSKAERISAFYVIVLTFIVGMKVLSLCKTGGIPCFPEELSRSC